MFLSVVIPVYNAEKCINRCLESIWKQGLSINDFEVICVDDCSTDHSIDIIKVQQERHDNLIIVYNSENLHAGGARNKGVREARGEYVAFIDAGDYYHNGSLKRAVNFLQATSIEILMCDSSREIAGYPNDEFVHNYLITREIGGGVL